MNRDLQLVEPTCFRQPFPFRQNPWSRLLRLQCDHVYQLVAFFCSWGCYEWRSESYKAFSQKPNAINAKVKRNKVDLSVTRVVSLYVFLHKPTPVKVREVQFRIKLSVTDKAVLWTEIAFILLVTRYPSLTIRIKVQFKLNIRSITAIVVHCLEIMVQNFFMMIVALFQSLTVNASQSSILGHQYGIHLFFILWFGLHV